MRIHNAASAAILVILFTIININGQTPNASAQLSKVVEFARLLETDPLGKDSKKAREWFNDWLQQTTLRRMPGCTGFFESEGKNKYSDELILQFKISTAAFMIEHTQQSQDPTARLLAGIGGMLKAYTKILQTNPQSTSRFLDSILTMQNNNQIANSVQDIMARCSDVPLSDKNPQLAPGDLVYASIEVETLPLLAPLPFPKYVESARRHRTKGKVVLHVVLGATGRVTQVEVIKGLPDGLTESSIKAAQAISFEPALVGGKPVSVVLKVEYTFIIE
jgi:TonB family protein